MHITDNNSKTIKGLVDLLIQYSKTVYFCKYNLAVSLSEDYMKSHMQ